MIQSQESNRLGRFTSIVDHSMQRKMARNCGTGHCHAVVTTVGCIQVVWLAQVVADDVLEGAVLRRDVNPQLVQ